MTVRRATLVRRYQRVINNVPMMDFATVAGLPRPENVGTAAAWGALGLVRDYRDRVNACDLPFRGHRALRRICAALESEMTDALLHASNGRVASS